MHKGGGHLAGDRPWKEQSVTYAFTPTGGRISSHSTGADIPGLQFFVVNFLIVSSSSSALSPVYTGVVARGQPWQLVPRSWYPLSPMIVPPVWEGFFSLPRKWHFIELLSPARNILPAVVSVDVAMSRYGSSHFVVPTPSVHTDHTYGLGPISLLRLTFDLIWYTEVN